MLDKAISSKDLMSETGISRATLNNYIAQGILPQPEVRIVAGGGRTRRLGYFPDEAVSTVQMVQSWKREGLSMDEIAGRVRADAPTEEAPTSAPRDPASAPRDNASAAGPKSKPSMPSSTKEEASRFSSGDHQPAPRGGTDGASDTAPGRRPSPIENLGAWTTNGPIDLDSIEHPAYMLNNRLELEWWNDKAETELFRRSGRDMPSDITERGLFGLLDRRSGLPASEDWEEVVRFHIGCAKSRLPQSIVYTLCAHLDKGTAGLLFQAYNEVDALDRAVVQHCDVNLSLPSQGESWYTIYATFFREGIFFVYVPARNPSEQVLSLLGRRDLVIRELLRRRRPYLTPLAVLVADLQDSTKICIELPPEEYFELINGFWRAMEPSLRRFHATHGKHVGDGVLYYFFPQPDSNYVDNAIRCALEMRELMRKVDLEWKARKNWNNDLKLNIGLDEGQEWFGAYQTPTHLEFAALGDTINRAARLSDFSRDGSIWSSKNLLNKLSHDERKKVRFGIHKGGPEDERTFIPETFARIGNLIDLDHPRNYKLRDLATFAVTEVMPI